MRVLIAAVLAVLTPLVLIAPAEASVHPAIGAAVLPAATTTDGRPTVGPLFVGGDVTGRHSCTASVIDSPSGDLILTAAHCVSGTGAGMAFAPGYHDGKTPYGVWLTTGAYVDPSWLSAQDPQHDYAVLTVAPHARGGRAINVQQVTGANAVGEPRPGNDVAITAVAYNSGVGGAASVCRTVLYWSEGYPTFSCAGFVSGSSGSPWLTRAADGGTEVVGVIGGLHQGGCLDFISYSSDFSHDIRRLMRRATHHEHRDTVPSPDSNGC